MVAASAGDDFTVDEEREEARENRDPQSDGAQTKIYIKNIVYLYDYL
jgi:hypothetical protein